MKSFGSGKSNFFASHGFGTWRQKKNYVFYGTIFWITVMVLANIINYERTKFRPGVGSYCVKKYKKCIQNYEYNSCSNSLYNCASLSSDDFGIFNFPEKINLPKQRNKAVKEIFTAEENELNRNLCFQTAGLSRNLCENLCFQSLFSYYEDQRYLNEVYDPAANIGPSEVPTYNHTKNFECMELCKYASGIQDSDDCPLEKRCPEGCPCKGYKCVKDYPRNDIVLIRKYHKYRIDLDDDIGFYKMTPTPFKIEKIQNQAVVQNFIRNTATFCSVWFKGAYYILVAVQSSSRSIHGNTDIEVYRMLDSGDLRLLQVFKMRLLIIFSERYKICATGLYKLRYDMVTQQYIREEKIFFCQTLSFNQACYFLEFGDGNKEQVQLFSNDPKKKTTIRP